MQRYCRLPSHHSAIDDQRNMVSLRKDVHSLLDQRRLALVAKRTPDDGAPQLVLHLLIPKGSSQLVHLYHNRLPHAITGVALEFLFARFAWSVFADENIPFFGHPDRTYAVLVFNSTTGQIVNEPIRDALVKGRAALFHAMSRSRSVSPKKKRLLEEQTACAGWDSDSSLGSGTDAVADDTDDNQDFRGRPRKRRRDDSWLPESVPNLVSGLASTASPSGAVSEPIDVSDTSIPVEQHVEKDGGLSLSPVVYTTELHL
ncbi:hypothetical protein B0T18DRAFT_112286 [Schizothecium vesticola]|uniref:HNH nuclease domain-containing protein n=1 Tax=Schizothecium vesticola TaxID=314040 RepID=A0AA40F1S1_9PEZI|nr:hypothetical protein B0T18DRAFT_112286 [Schizothecium vesticola]